MANLTFNDLDPEEQSLIEFYRQCDQEAKEIILQSAKLIEAKSEELRSQYFFGLIGKCKSSFVETAYDF